MGLSTEADIKYDYDVTVLDADGEVHDRIASIAPRTPLHAGDWIHLGNVPYEVVRVSTYFDEKAGPISGQHKERDIPDVIVRKVER